MSLVRCCTKDGDSKGEVMKIKIEKMTESQVKELLKELIEKLDNLDTEDYFGTEGWRHLFGYED